MNYNICFILGLCGSGKTTLIENLLSYGVNNVYDFDSTGVPEKPTHAWRIKNTNDWISRLSKSKKSSVLAGFMYPSEIFTSKAYNLVHEQIYFIYLKVKPCILKERLLLRGWSEEQIEWTLSQEEIILQQLSKIKHTIIQL